MFYYYGLPKLNGVYICLLGCNYTST
jgi:hypothetical protein